MTNRLPKWTWYQGFPTSLTLTFSSTSGTIDITGSIIYLTVKKNVDNSSDDSTAIFTLDQASHVDTTTSLLSVSGANTSVTLGTYKYDLFKNTSFLGEGIVEVIKTVNQRARP